MTNVMTCDITWWCSWSFRYTFLDKFIASTQLVSDFISYIKDIFSVLEGAVNVDESVVGSMIALDSDVHVLNGHHVTTSPQLISTQSPQIDMTTLLSSSQPSSAIPVTTIVSSSPLLSAVAAVKNEPEDLTGQRRDSSNNNNNNSSISSNNNPSDPSNGALLATTNDAIHV